MLSTKEQILIDHIERELGETGKYPSYSTLTTMMGYKSKRSIFLLVKSLEEKGYLRKNEDSKIRLIKNINTTNSIDTIDVPLVGEVACGAPILAEENVEAIFSISTQIVKPNHDYFLLRAKGDSMNRPSETRKAIHHGDFVLIQSQNHAEDGDWVLAIINNEATIKEFQKLDGHIALIPRSDNEDHKPIIVSDDLIIQGIVVDVLKGLDKINF